MKAVSVRFFFFVLTVLFVPSLGSAQPIASSANNNHPSYVPGKVIVKLKSHAYGRRSLRKNPFGAIGQDLGIEVDRELLTGSKRANSISLRSRNSRNQANNRNEYYLLSIANDVEVSDAVEQLSNHPDVESAQPDYIYKIQNTENITNDPYVSGQRLTLERLNLGDAWDQTEGENVVVAVIDTGVNYRDPDIDDNIWVNPGEDLNNNGRLDGVNTCPIPNGDFDCVDNDGNGLVDDLVGYDFTTCESWSDTRDCNAEKEADNDPSEEDPDDLHGHVVALLIAAERDNSEGGVGIAPRAQIMPIRSLNGSGRSSDLAEALEYARLSGADVINNSWSFDEQKVDGVINEQVHLAYLDDIVVVFSAGNDSKQLEPPKEGISPSTLTETITVAAVFNTFTTKGEPVDSFAEFSNYGWPIDVSATGANLFNIGRGNGIVSGTSFAAPMVSGLAALLRSKNPNWNNEEVKSAIRVSADNIDHMNPGYEGQLGTGKINIENALNQEPVSDVRLNEIDIFRTDSPRFGLIELYSPASIVFKLRNGWAKSGEITAKFKASDDFRDDIEIISGGEFSFSSIASGEEVSNANSPLIIRAVGHDPSVKYSFELELSDVERGVSRTHHFSLEFKAPRISLGDPEEVAVIDDSNSVNNNLSLDPGEELDLYISLSTKLYNRFVEYDDVHAVLSTDEIGVEVIAAESGYESVSGRPVTGGPFTIRLSDDIGRGRQLRFNLEVSSGGEFITSVPLRLKVPELLRRSGWPYNMPTHRRISNNGIFGKPIVKDLDSDGKLETAFIARDKVHVLDHNGNEPYADMPWGSFADNEFINNNNSSIFPADLDGDQDDELIVFTVGVEKSIRIFHHDGSIYAPKLRFDFFGFPLHSALADVDGDGRLEFVLQSAIHNTFRYQIFRLGSSLEIISDFELESSCSDDAIIKMVLADMNNDGKFEIIQLDSCSSTKPYKVHVVDASGNPISSHWPAQINHPLADLSDSQARILVADVDGNGTQEIVVRGTYIIFVLDAKGEMLPNWPYAAGYKETFDGEPVLADINGDGTLEIISFERPYFHFATRTLKALDPVTATVVSEFDFEAGQYFSDNILVQDLDGDEVPEVIMLTYDSFLQVWNANGESLPDLSYPLDEMKNIIAIADLDADGTLEIVGNTRKLVSVRDAGFTGNPDIQPWPSFRHNLHRTGSVIEQYSGINIPPPVITEVNRVKPEGGVVSLKTGVGSSTALRIKYDSPQNETVTFRLEKASGRFVGSPLGGSKTYTRGKTAYLRFYVDEQDFERDSGKLQYKLIGENNFGQSTEVLIDYHRSQHAQLVSPLPGQLFLPGTTISWSPGDADYVYLSVRGSRNRSIMGWKRFDKNTSSYKLKSIPSTAGEISVQLYGRTGSSGRLDSRTYKLSPSQVVPSPTSSPSPSPSSFYPQ